MSIFTWLIQNLWIKNQLQWLTLKLIANGETLMSGLIVRFHVVEEVKVERESKVSLNRLEVLLALDKHQRQEIVMHSLVQVPSIAYGVTLEIGLNALLLVPEGFKLERELSKLPNPMVANLAKAKHRKIKIAILNLAQVMWYCCRNGEGVIEITRE